MELKETCGICASKFHDTLNHKDTIMFAENKVKFIVIQEVERFFDISKEPIDNYWECGINEIRDFIKTLKEL